MASRNEKWQELRLLAERELVNRDAETANHRTEDDVSSLLHELHVHQIELELQNEELRLTQQNLLQSQTQYKELFDFAPLSYFTVDEDGRIYQANNTAVEQFGRSYSEFNNLSFVELIAEKDRDTYHLFYRRLMRSRTRHTAEVSCLRKDGTQFYALLEGVPKHPAEKSDQFSIIVNDISQQKMYQMRLHGLHILDRALLRSHSIQEMIAVVLDHLFKLVDTPKLQICIFSDNGGEYPSIYTRATHRAGVRVREARLGALFESPLSPDEYRIITQEHQSGGPPEAYVVVPIYESDEQRGLIVAELPNPEQIDQNVLKIIQETSVQIGIAIQKANLHQQVVQHSHELEARVEDRTQKLREREQSEHQQRIFAEALLDISRSLNSTLDLDQVLDRILINLGRVVTYERASIMLVENGIGRIVKWRGDYPEGFENTIQSNLEQLNKNEFVQLVEQGARSFVKLPIRSGEVTQGVLSLDKTDLTHLSDDEIMRLEAFADLASIALNNAHLHQQGQKLAVLEERQRLARDLHDAVSQTLFSLRVTSESLQKNLRHDKLEKYLGDITHLARSAQAEMRLLMMELHPMAMQDTKVEGLIEKLVLGFKGRTKRNISLEVDEIPTLSPKEKNVCFRIAQEALNNIIKYAKTNQVNVTLKIQDGHVVLRIQDDGQGFDVQENTKYGHGLMNMRERADEVGGQLVIESQINVGTTVQLMLPLESVSNSSS